MAEDPDGHKIRVIIADDHTVVRQGTRELLAREPDLDVVGEASDGLEAVGLVRELRPDVAILDIAMPNMNGIEATRLIKQEWPETGILILTAYDYDEYVIAMVEAGAAGYILKTANYSQVVSAVRGVSEGDAVLGPFVARKVWSHFKEHRSRPKHVGEKSEGLSQREREVLKEAARGLSNKEIAQVLAMSSRTVQTHLQDVFGKLGVASRTEAVVKGIREGWLHVEDLA